jgi:hypothetical protein
MHLELRNKVLSPLEKGSRRGFVFADLSDYPLNIKRHRALATDRFSLRFSELAILEAKDGLIGVHELENAFATGAAAQGTKRKLFSAFRTLDFHVYGFL